MTKVLDMTNPPIDEEDLGPAMRALNDAQRLFVHTLAENGDNNYSRAAREAFPNMNDASGRSYGSKLARHPKVLAAIHEEAKKRMGAAALMVASRAAALANNPLARDHLKALTFIADRIGMAPEKKLTIDAGAQVSEKELIAKAMALCSELGIDPEKLIGAALARKALVVDASFTEVAPAVEKATGFALAPQNILYAAGKALPPPIPLQSVGVEDDLSDLLQ